MRSLPVLLALCSAGAIPLSAPALAAGPANRIVLDEPLIMQIRLNRQELYDAILVYPDADGFKLPLGTLASALDFPIRVYPSQGKAEGWFIREDRRFDLELDKASVVIDGVESSFDPSQVQQQADDLYVDTRLLSRWFPVDFQVQLEALRLELKAREALPISERLARERLRLSLVGQQQGGGAVHRQVYSDYEAYSHPSLELGLRYRHRNTDGESSDTSSYSALLAGDLLWSTASLSLSGDDEDSLRSARLNLARVEQTPAVLGIRSSRAGDVHSPQLRDMALSASGRGLVVSSFPLQRSSEFSTTTVRGDAQPGWDIELYRNGTLLEAQVVDAAGQYEFLEVPLLSGSNELRVVLYGPQGQRRERVEQVYAGGIQIRPGETQFRVAAMEQGETLIDTGEQNSEDYRDPRLTLQLEQGINQQLSATASAAQLPGDESRAEETLQVYSAGIRAAVGGAFTEISALGDSDRGRAWQFAVQTRQLGVSLNLLHTQMDDYNGEVRSNVLNGSLESRSDIRLDGALKLSNNIPWSLRTQIEHDVNGERGYLTSLRLSYGLSGLHLSNTLDYTTTTLGTPTLDGRLLASTRSGDWRTRAGLDYQLRDSREIEGGDLTVSWQDGQRIGADFTVDHTRTNHLTSYGASFFRKFDDFIVSLDVELDSEGDYSAGASLFTSIGHDPARDEWFASSGRLASQGALAAKVYLDENGNGRYDEGERTIKGARFNGAAEKVTTDAEGSGLVTGLSPNRARRLSLDPASLEDPYWLPAFTDVEFVPHPGKVQLLDVPVAVTGEIDGVVRLREAQGLRALSNVQVELVDPEGEVVASTRTAFDGFYLFDGVPPGEYVVRASPAQLSRLELSAATMEPVELKGGAVLSALDLQLQRPGDNPMTTADLAVRPEPVCTVYGPIIDKQAVADIFRTATAVGARPLIRSASHHGAVFYGIYLPPLATEAETTATLAVLDRNGFENRLMLRGEYRRHIALGYFRHRIYARERLELLHRAGFETAALVKRPRRQNSYWVRTVSPDATSAAALKASLDERELGVQYRGCRLPGQAAETGQAAMGDANS